MYTVIRRPGTTNKYRYGQGRSLKQALKTYGLRLKSQAYCLRVLLADDVRLKTLSKEVQNT